MSQPMSQPTTLSIRRPDDWHVHLRDGEMLRGVVPYTARQFALYRVIASHPEQIFLTGTTQ